MTTQITQAAIRVDGEVWTLPRPARHHVLQRAWKTSHPLANMPTHEQGFFTSDGYFVDRKLAAKIARDAGQVPEVKRTNPQDELFTEDLW